MVSSLAALLVIVSMFLRLIDSTKFQFFGGSIERAATAEKVVALTFDDGPQPGHTPATLKILEQLGVKGTFYLEGQYIERYKQEARAIVAAGHQVGNHSYSHPTMVFKTRPFIRDQIDRTSALIREIGYDGPMTFRPPYGKKFLYLPYYLKKQGVPTVLWDVEPEYYSKEPASTRRTIEYTLSHVRPGSIVVLHAMNDSLGTKAALKPIVQNLKNQGYSFVTINELLNYHNKKLP